MPLTFPSPYLTVVIRDDSPMVHAGDSPSYRTVRVTLTGEQVEALALRHGMEAYSRAIVEPVQPPTERDS